MHQLYPEIEPYVTHSIKVDEPHLLYVEECGSPSGIPVVFIHGGPGAGCEPFHRRFYDPERFRIILFDQRGSGRSTPHASLEGNTSGKLVEDMEKIREHLGIDKWLLFGGSWGSTLALLYAQTHPQRVLGLILRGIFLCTPEEIHWFYQDGASRLFPDFWEDYLKPVPPEQRDNLLEAYYKILTGEDEVARMAAAKAWSLWEGRTSTLRPANAVVDHFGNPHTALSLARIEAHYFVNNTFLEPDQLIRDMDRINHLPGTIVHGRYDVVCPVQNAWRLHKAWPGATLRIIPDAGHSALEPGIVNALVGATEIFADKLGG